MAKAKKKRAKKTEQPAPEPKKKGLAANKKRRRARARANPARAAARSNPPVTADLTHVILPGFAAFAATKVVARIVYSFVQARFPKLGKHAHAAAGVAGFGAAWFGAHRVKQLAAYHDGIIAGSGMAALHGIAQAYLPEKYRWLLAEPKPSDVTPKAPAADLPTTQPLTALPSDGDEYGFLEEQISRTERDRRIRSVPAPQPSSTPRTDALTLAGENSGDDVQFDPDLLEELGGDNIDSLFTGTFGN